MQQLSLEKSELMAQMNIKPKKCGKLKRGVKIRIDE